MTTNPTHGRPVSTDSGRDASQGWMPFSVVDPKGGHPAGRNLLVVSTAEDVAGSLSPHVRNTDVVKVVVPVVGQGLLDWLANDERAFSRAEAVAQATAEQLPAGRTAARAGEADVGLAIRDALATFPADEILIAVESSGWTLADSLEVDDPRGSSARTIAGVPVRIVAVTPA